jgi:hypothetical protein
MIIPEQKKIAYEIFTSEQFKTFQTRALTYKREIVKKSEIVELYSSLETISTRGVYLINSNIARSNSTLNSRKH